jgi:hypothetical protein
LGKDRQLRGGEKGGREKAQPSKKKDRAMKRKQKKLDRLQRQRDRRLSECVRTKEYLNFPCQLFY